MDIQLIQRQIPIGTPVRIVLNTGHDVVGVLVEIGREHVALESDHGISTVQADAIAMVDSSEVPRDPKASTITDRLPFKTPHDDAEDGGSTNPQQDYPPEVSLREDAQKRVFEIEVQFEARISMAQLEYSEPDFEFHADEFFGYDTDKVKQIWNRVTDKYRYAKKTKELGKDFGRLGPIVRDLEQLAATGVKSATLYRHLSYLQYLSDRLPDALDSAQTAALYLGEPDDWYSLAALAVECNDLKLACYALEQYFQRSHLTSFPNAWLVYVGLVRAIGAYTSLSRVYDNPERELSDEEWLLIFESLIYLIHEKAPSTAHTLISKWIDGEMPESLAREAFSSIEGDTIELLEEAKDSLEDSIPIHVANNKVDTANLKVKGQITRFLRDRNFGFIRDESGTNYFFHGSAVIDPALRNELASWDYGSGAIVIFEVSEGPRGPIGLRVALWQTVDELIERANQYADEGGYSQAIGYIKQVLEREPNHQKAKDLHEKWREYARIEGVPKGSNPYARAKRAHIIEKSLEKAIKLYKESISANDNVESSVKDLAMIYSQQGNSKQAIQFLEGNRNKIKDQQSVDNMLTTFYQKAGEHDKALELLQRKLRRTNIKDKRTSILWQIAIHHLQLEQYPLARQQFESVLKLDKDNIGAQRNIAICYFKENDLIQAELRLNQILDKSPDPKAAELLEAIQNLQKTGESVQLDVIIDTMLADTSFTGEISGFTQFFLKRNEYHGVPPDRLQDKALNQQDVKSLENLATRLGTKRPRERASYYMSAAQIVAGLEIESNEQFYRYLARSFSSSGDAMVTEGKPLESAREYYCEALSAYDRCRVETGDEQDAVNALVRFLYSTLGATQIPFPNTPSIDEAIERVLLSHPVPNQAFEEIGYLIYRSRYAANRILRRLSSASSLQAVTRDYLKGKNISVPQPARGFPDFVSPWNDLNRRRLDTNRATITELHHLQQMTLTTASMANGIERLKAISNRLFFKLDQDRVRRIQGIIEMMLSLVREIGFEEQERLCAQIRSHAEELIREIEHSPTKISVEELLPLVEMLDSKTRDYLDELYVRSVPQVELRLPVESYTPDENWTIGVQLVVENKVGSSPAEDLELIFQEEEDAYSVFSRRNGLDGSLRGGEQRIIEVPIQVSSSVVDSNAFSVPIYAQYKTRSGEITQTTVRSFAIRLNSHGEFTEIDNPYAAYAEGGVVGDRSMFFGRDELIANVTQAIERAQKQSKSIVIFGQKRAGKSSILFHLQENLRRNPNLIVLDLGNIGSILDEQSSTPLVYQILWTIMVTLRDEIADRVIERDAPFLELSLPSDLDYYSHPSPLLKFKEIFSDFQRLLRSSEGWSDVRIVLLIDEFSYIYGQIEQKRIPETFMKNWKALLQENYFSAVLAGQDVMPAFKARFPNEFGTTQDERVSYLRNADAIRLIDEPIRIGGPSGDSRFREQAINVILDLTAGSPFYIQIVCNRLVQYMNEKRADLVTEADVERVAQELIRGVNALSLDKFDNLISSGDVSVSAISESDTLAVLRSIANNSITGPCNRNSIECITDAPVDAILDDLVNREVVEREREHYYRIRVGLFRDWLLAH